MTSEEDNKMVFIGYVVIKNTNNGELSRCVKEGKSGPRTDNNAPTVYKTWEAAKRALFRAVRSESGREEYVIVSAYVRKIDSEASSRPRVLLQIKK